MDDHFIEERQDELRGLLDAMRTCPEQNHLKDAQRFAAIQRSIAEHQGEGCKHTGYPVAAR